MPAEKRPRGERLQKVLARAGVASRRQAEALIRAGRVQVNGVTVREMGVRVLPTDRIAVDGRPVEAEEELAYYMLYKPRGYLSTVRDDRGRRVAADLVPKAPRLYPVGRLDLDSEGLLLFTNDGPLTLRLTHPRYAHVRSYRVLVRGVLPEDAEERFRRGVPLEGEKRPGRGKLRRLPLDYRWQGRAAGPGERWLAVTLREGRKRQIRRMFQALGAEVLRLVRVRMATLTLGKLAPGQGRWLTPGEVRALRRYAGLADNPTCEE